jgi:DNA invertase Pin-like site-specific DNA recombinase
MPPAFIAYYRVSTDRQGASGLGLEAQRQTVADHVARSGGALMAEFTEIESGARKKRPQLHAALVECQRRKATLIIAKLDRLGRNVAFIAALMESGVEFIAADNPQASRLLLHLLAAFAEHKREQISQRTKDALAAAKRRGVIGCKRARAWRTQSRGGGSLRQIVAPRHRGERAGGGVRLSRRGTVDYGPRGRDSVAHSR